MATKSEIIFAAKTKNYKTAENMDFIAETFSRNFR